MESDRSFPEHDADFQAGTIPARRASTLTVVTTREPKTKTRLNLHHSRAYYHFLFGALLSYVLVGLHVWSTAYFIVELKKFGCHTINDYDFESLDPEARERCLHLVGGTVCTIHNVTFGLLSAVVVYQLGDQVTDSQNDGGLYGKFQRFIDDHNVVVGGWVDNLATSGKRGTIVLNGTQQEDHGNENRTSKCTWYQCLYVWPTRVIYNLSLQFVLCCTRVCVLAWIVNGLVCLLYGSIWGAVESGPLHTTGQAWLGIAVTTTFSFLGVNEKGETGEEATATATATNTTTREEVQAIVGEQTKAIVKEMMKMNTKEEGGDPEAPLVVDVNKMGGQEEKSVEFKDK
eukprot:CAMPEP_0183708504 /NCGR_PEP_ID=MMETSP0737-20130205/4809_1 /TAXON_ID=385413 /ORGANISM="Thalassiosira miniscula, Strain CCMP1093" /LENGTH=343 /DNA_ID=CAMNT_0025936397 /DNA_START=74 /DNA_END=1105 /DNA_ORIENTATION=-